MKKKIIAMIIIVSVLIGVVITFRDKPIYEFIYFLGIVGIALSTISLLSIIGHNLLKRWDRFSALLVLPFISLINGLPIIALISAVAFITISIFLNRKYNEKIDIKLSGAKLKLFCGIVGILLFIISSKLMPSLIVDFHNEMVVAENRIEYFNENYSKSLLYKNNQGDLLSVDFWNHPIEKYDIKYEGVRKFNVIDSKYRYTFIHYSGQWRLIDIVETSDTKQEL